MIGGRFATSGNTGGSGTRPERALEAINNLPRAQRESRCLARASLRAQVGSRGAEPGYAETVRESRGKASSIPRLIQVRKPLPDLVSVLQKESQFRFNRDLGRGEKRFDQDTSAANGHRGETFEPITGRHLGMGVELDGQRFEGMGVDAARGDPLEQMPPKRPWDVFALDFRHQEPA